MQPSRHGSSPAAPCKHAVPPSSHLLARLVQRVADDWNRLSGPRQHARGRAAWPGTCTAHRSATAGCAPTAIGSERALLLSSRRPSTPAAQPPRSALPPHATAARAVRHLCQPSICCSSTTTIPSASAAARTAAPVSATQSCARNSTLNRLAVNTAAAASSATTSPSITKSPRAALAAASTAEPSPPPPEAALLARRVGAVHRGPFTRDYAHSADLLSDENHCQELHSVESNRSDGFPFDDHARSGGDLLSGNLHSHGEASSGSELRGSGWGGQTFSASAQARRSSMQPASQRSLQQQQHTAAAHDVQHQRNAAQDTQQQATGAGEQDIQEQRAAAVTGHSTSRGSVRREQPPDQQPLDESLPSLALDLGTMAAAFGVPVRSARALLGQHGGVLSGLKVAQLRERCTSLAMGLGISMEQVFTLASRQPVVLRSSTAPSATVAQVRELAAALGLDAIEFAALVARQPEFLEVTPPERLAARAEALATVLGLRQHAQQTRGPGMPAPQSHNVQQPKPSKPPQAASHTHSPSMPASVIAQQRPPPPPPPPPPQQQQQQQEQQQQLAHHGQPFAGAQPMHADQLAPAAHITPQPQPLHAPARILPSEDSSSRSSSSSSILHSSSSSSSSGSSGNSAKSLGSGTASPPLIRPTMPHRSTHSPAVSPSPLSHSTSDQPAPPTLPTFPTPPTQLQGNGHTFAQSQQPHIPQPHPYNSSSSSSLQQQQQQQQHLHQHLHQQQVAVARSQRRQAHAWGKVAKRAAQAEALARTRLAGLSVMARLPSTEFFMLIALPPAALSRRLLQLEGVLMHQGTRAPPRPTSPQRGSFAPAAKASQNRPSSSSDAWPGYVRSLQARDACNDGSSSSSSSKIGSSGSTKGGSAQRIGVHTPSSSWVVGPEEPASIDDGLVKKDNGQSGKEGQRSVASRDSSHTSRSNFEGDSSAASSRNMGKMGAGSRAYSREGLDGGGGSDEDSVRLMGANGVRRGHSYGVLDVQGMAALCPSLLVAPLSEVNGSWRALSALLSPHSKPAQRAALISRDPALLLVAPRSMRAVLDWLRAELGMSAREAAACVLQQPKLLKREPASLLAQLQELSSKLGVDEARIRLWVRRAPSLLGQEPASTAAKVHSVQLLLSVSGAQVRELLTCTPALLTHSLPTLTQKLERLGHMFASAASPARLQPVSNQAQHVSGQPQLQHCGQDHSDQQHTDKARQGTDLAQLLHGRHRRTIKPHQPHTHQTQGRTDYTHPQFSDQRLTDQPQQPHTDKAQLEAYLVQSQHSGQRLTDQPLPQHSDQRHFHNAQHNSGQHLTDRPQQPCNDHLHFHSAQQDSDLIDQPQQKHSGQRHFHGAQQDSDLIDQPQHPHQDQQHFHSTQQDSKPLHHHSADQQPHIPSLSEPRSTSSSVGFDISPAHHTPPPAHMHDSPEVTQAIVPQQHQSPMSSQQLHTAPHPPQIQPMHDSIEGVQESVPQQSHSLTSSHRSLTSLQQLHTAPHPPQIQTHPRAPHTHHAPLPRARVPTAPDRSSTRASSNSTEAAARTQVAHAAARRLVLCEPHLLTQSTSSLHAKLVALSDTLCTPLTEAKQVVLRCPTLLAMPTKQLQQGVHQLAWQLQGEVELEVAERLKRASASRSESLESAQGEVELEVAERLKRASASHSESLESAHTQVPLQQESQHQQEQHQHHGHHEQHQHHQQQNYQQQRQQQEQGIPGQYVHSEEWEHTQEGGRGEDEWAEGGLASIGQFVDGFKAMRKRAQSQKRQAAVQAAEVQYAAAAIVRRWPQVLLVEHGAPAAALWRAVDVIASRSVQALGGRKMRRTQQRSLRRGGTSFSPDHL